MPELINLQVGPIRDVLARLLVDKSTGKNIIFATDTYTEQHPNITARTPMTEEILLGLHSLDIQPRVLKAKVAQELRTKSKAEVFTPSWICNKMNNICDAEWFGREDVFTVETEKGWVPTEGKIAFPQDKTWRDYINSTRLEITCGEAPYIVSRYDAVSGELLPISKRIGMLDRKLRAINEHINSRDEWYRWVYRAFQSVYGYEYQGDNLLIARINLLLTFCDHAQARWQERPSSARLNKIAEVISANFWQMDGLQGTVPHGGLQEYKQLDLFETFELSADEGSAEQIECVIRDWQNDRDIVYNDLKRGNKMKLFDFCIGNPPYQEVTAKKETKNGQKNVKSIFHNFQMEADKISKTTELIYPAKRWIHRSGRGLKQFGIEQINDRRLARLIVYPDAKEVFPSSADISDGISIVIKSDTHQQDKFKYIYIYIKELPKPKK